MATETAERYARRLSVGIILHTGQEFYPNHILPYGALAMAVSTMQPRLMMGLEKIDGMLDWLIGRAFIVNGQRYLLENYEGILVKIRFGEVMPIIRTAPDYVYEKTQATLWPIIAPRRILTP